MPAKKNWKKNDFVFKKTKLGNEAVG